MSLSLSFPHLFHNVIWGTRKEDVCKRVSLYALWLLPEQSFVVLYKHTKNSILMAYTMTYLRLKKQNKKQLYS